MPRAPNDRRHDEHEAAGEEALIAEYWAPLAAGFEGAYGLKDDCATLEPPPGNELVVTTDALIEGVHFLPAADAADVAWKALAVNVSDLVAKGATPLAYVMHVALPEVDRAWLASFAAGLAAAQRAFGCPLAGGDTDRTPGPRTVSITAFGCMPKGRMVRRGTARPNDLVYVSGTIGDAALGLALRRDPHLRSPWNLDDAACRFVEERFSRPHPPVALAPALLAHASAAMDISDGLMKDFARLCRASEVGGRLEAGRVPLSGPARSVVAADANMLERLMSGGEDYEALACVPPAIAARFEQAAEQAGTRVTCIGAIDTPAAGIAAIDGAGAPMRFTKSGWDHFSAR
jgi:thiamine-monophosphate kinase